MVIRRIPIVFLLVAGVSLGCATPDTVDRVRTGGEEAGDAGSSPAGETQGAGGLARLGNAPRVVFLGDSLAYGLGLARDEAVPALIQARLDEAGLHYQSVNRGVSGDTSAAGLRRLDLALEGDVRLVVLELGANDMLRGLQPAQMEDNLRAIIERCLERNIEVALTGMEALPNYGEAYTREFREVFSGLADEYGLVLVPFFLEGVAGDPELNQRDMMHPNARGARIVADNLWRVLEPILE